MNKLIPLAVFLAISTPAFAQTYTVQRVIDGDTLVVVTPEGGTEKVRLIGIDTPENRLNDKARRDSERTGQDVETITKMGKKAAEFVEEVFSYYHNNIILEYDVQEKDKYQRLLAYVFIETGFSKDDVINMPVPGDYHFIYRDDKQVIFLNAAIIKNGFATPMTIPPNVKYVDLFQKLYKEARANKRGLWIDKKPSFKSDCTPEMEMIDACPWMERE